MVLDQNREKSIKGSVEVAGNGKRRLRSVARNSNKTNKRLEDPGARSTYMEAKKNGRASTRYDDEDEDDDDMSMVTIYDDGEDSTTEDAEASLSELETVQTSRKRKVITKKKKLAKKNPQVKMKSRFEFPYEAMEVSDEEDDDDASMIEACKNCKSNLAKKQFAIIAARMKKKKKKKALARKTRKAKTKSTARKRPTRRRTNKNKGGDYQSPDNSTVTGIVTEEKSSKQALQKDKNGDEKKGDARNDKATAEERKVDVAANKGDVNPKSSKENASNKDGKGNDRMEDLSKKVDRKEAENVDEGLVAKPRVTRSRKPVRMTSGGKASKTEPFVEFFMTVYRELCETGCSMRTVAREAAKRWNGMSADDKKFYTGKIR